MRKEVEGLKNYSHLFADLQAVFLIVVEGNAVYDNSTAIGLLQSVETAK
jgi:hypothetical protein